MTARTPAQPSGGDRAMVTAALERAKQDRDSAFGNVERQPKGNLFAAYIAAFSDRAVLATEVERLQARLAAAERVVDAAREVLKTRTNLPISSYDYAGLKASVLEYDAATHPDTGGDHA